MPPKRKAAVTAETKSKKQKNEEEEVQEEGEEHEEAMETKDLGNNWKIDNSVVRYDPPGLKGSASICAFDIDDTIIRVIFYIFILFYLFIFTLFYNIELIRFFPIFQ